MADITEVNNMATTAAMTKKNTTPTDLTRGARTSQQLANPPTAVMRPQGTTFAISNSIWVTTTGSIPSISATSTGVSIPALPTYIVPPGMILPQPLYRAPPTEAFNLQQAISDVVSNQVKTMEKHIHQAVGLPATYEDLLDEMDQSPSLKRS
ncbi:hypothetical protein TIFTF001_015369 [Ficus carica]|uniref:Uncharacterized protein n=1 Tax=Ficus carica TaxID=3494 RepID=A0AA88ALG4_FICCA|nr:hypothetical protein TIFTF001_015369 [Ficus carica]